MTACANSCAQVLLPLLDLGLFLLLHFFHRSSLRRFVADHRVEFVQAACLACIV